MFNTSMAVSALNLGGQVAHCPEERGRRGRAAEMLYYLPETLGVSEFEGFRR